MSHRLHKNQQGFSLVEGLLVIIALALIVFVGYYVWHAQGQSKTSTTKDSAATPAATDSGNAKPAQVAYTSDREQASFTYPSTWTKTDAALQPSLDGADAIGLQSPDGKVTVSWVTGIGGIGGACGQDAAPGQLDADGLGGCPATTVLDSTAITGAPGLYVVSGYITYDDSSYYPWIAVQDKDGTTSGRKMGYEVFEGKVDDENILFGIGGLNKGKPAPSFGTKGEVAAFLSTDSAKQAKQILLSLKYKS